MLIDTHSHINHEKLSNTLDEIIDNLETGRVGGVICPSYSLDSSITSLKVANRSPRVYCALGIHPENCVEWNEQAHQFLLENLNNLKVVAVGEIGLDYHYGTEQADLQKKVLIEQLKLAKQFDLPVIFHVRDAWEDFFAVVSEYRDLIKRGVVHCFEGNSAIAQKALALGLYISVTGLITFKPRATLRAAVAEIPIQKIMVETDAPYLAPEPHRGEINRPEYTAFVADKIAEIKGMTSQQVDEITTNNAYTFFDKMEKIQ